MIRAVRVTRHVPLSAVAALLRYEEIRDAAVLAEKALREDLDIRSPRLALPRGRWARYRRQRSVHGPVRA